MFDIFLCLQYITGTVLAIVFGYLIYFKIQFHIGKQNGVPRVAASFPFGIVGNCYLENKSFPDIMSDVYNKFQGYGYVEVFQTDFITGVIRDPDIIKSVILTDNHHFTGRGFRIHDMDEVLAADLFSMGGDAKRKMRAKIAPTYTPSKMKMMFKMILETGLVFQDCVKDLASIGEIVNIRDIVGRFLTDATMSCAFGTDSNTLRNPNSEVLLRGREFYLSQCNSYLGTQILPKYRNISIPRKVTQFFLDLVKETVEYREKNNVRRKDFMDLMIQLKNKGYLEDDKVLTDKSSLPAEKQDTRKLTIEEVASQAFAFFLGGFEPSSIIITHCMYELAKHPDIQDKLRTEVKEVLSRHDGQVTYDNIQEMVFLDKTIRKYPIGPTITRECTKEYKLKNPAVTIAEGTMMVVPVIAMHHDPMYFPEPEKFDPERFTPEAKAARKPFTYIPFGEGPHMCIGMRFGLMQSKLAIIMLLLNSRVSLCYKTITPNAAKRKPTSQTAMGLFLRMDAV